jgi:hypothetical protein
MKPFAQIVLATLLFGTAAMAQSQQAISVSRELRRAGVSDECISRLSTHDFAVLSGILNGGGAESDGSKRQKMKFQAEKACGG